MLKFLMEGNEVISSSHNFLYLSKLGYRNMTKERSVFDVMTINDG
jgi:hypothetical protein